MRDPQGRGGQGKAACMTLTITIEMDNAAFDTDSVRHDEAARILRAAADRIEAGAWTHDLLDTNGNTVGHAEVTQ